MNRFEKIRRMTIEEMARFLDAINVRDFRTEICENGDCTDGCNKCWERWLQNEDTMQNDEAIKHLKKILADYRYNGDCFEYPDSILKWRALKAAIKALGGTTDE